MNGPTVVVVGVTGAVGRVFLQVLAERRFPVGELRLCASSRSAGKELSVNGERLRVQETTPDSFRGADLVFISVSSGISRKLAPIAVEAGAVVIDDSSAFRMEPTVPLVVPEINADDVEWHQGILSIPNCSTTQMVMALYPLHRANPIKRVIVDSYQSVSGTGAAAMEELRVQSRQVLEGEPTKAEKYPHQIAFSVLPHIEPFLENGYTREEWKMLEETRKIMHAPEIAVSATCVRVPVLVGHSEAVHVEFTHPMTPAEARELLAAFPGVRVVDDPANNTYPMPIDCVGSDDVLVGRIRQDASHPNGLAMWVVSDNLRKGAATNALQIAEEVVKRGLLTRQRAQKLAARMRAR
ncbi:MAG: aspartate-semialdehyde dehydrogenase [Chloroflexi bacterium]|nr:aspartate-semialdehyde dehydrogenase [Chloroflexota bacterium]